jgi:hypothetical protein
MSAHPASRFLMDFEKGTKPPPPAPAARAQASPSAAAVAAAPPLAPLMPQVAAPAAPSLPRKPSPAPENTNRTAPPSGTGVVAQVPAALQPPTMTSAPVAPADTPAHAAAFAPLDAAVPPPRPRTAHRSELPPLVLPEMPEFPPAPMPPPPPQPAAVSEREQAEYERGFAAGIAAAQARHSVENARILEEKAEELAAGQRAAREAEMGRLRDAIAIAMDGIRAEADAALAAALAPLAAAMVRTAAFEQLRSLLVGELGAGAMDLVIRGPVTDCVTLQAMLLRSGISARLEYSADKEIEVTANGEVFRTRMDRIIADFVAGTPVEAPQQGRKEQPAGDLKDAD